MRPLITLLSFAIATACQATTFHIGNSLTYDTKPGALPDQEHSIFAGKSIDYIYDHPDDYDVSTSLRWDEALVDNQYSIVTVQPYPVDSIESVIEDVSAWMALQPDAKFVIHTGWGTRENLTSSYMGGTAVTSPEFLDAVAAGLPRPTVRTYAIDALIFIDQDPNSPYDGAAELYRDLRHMTYGDGRYLQHQIMRRALGLPLIDEWPLEIEHKEYLDSLLYSGDFDFDGDADGKDFLIWQRYRTGAETPAYPLHVDAAYVVPEPSCLVLVLFGVAVNSSISRAGK